jgi:hypothetical protein
MTHEVMSKCFEFGQREFDTKETLNLLKMYGFRFMSWGSNGFRNLNDKVLVFKVQGHHHKGYVCISLGWNDTYTIRLMSTHGNVKFEMEGVYFDMLFDILDEKIERIPEYSN